MKTVFLNTSYDQHADHRILEVPSDLNVNDGVAYLTSGDDHQALLCTLNQSYSIRKVEYSNSLIVSRKRTRESDGVDGATAAVWTERLSKLFEVTPCKPRSEQALRQLRGDYLTLPELEGEDIIPPRGITRYTFGELAAQAPCAVMELKDRLISECALVYKGKVRLPHPSMVCHAADAVMLYLDGVHTVDEAKPDGSNKGVSVDWADVVEYFVPSVYPKLIMDVVRLQLQAPPGKKATCDTISDGDQDALRPRLSEQRMLILLAQCALESLAPPPTTNNTELGALAWVSLESFLERWRSRIPFRLIGSFVANAASLGADSKEDLCEPLLPLLRGYVVVQSSGSGIAMQRRIAWCHPSQLPQLPEDRARRLLELCPGKWTDPDLRAFIEPLVEPGMSFEASISKVCKDHRVPGKVVSYTLHA